MLLLFRNKSINQLDNWSFHKGLGSDYEVISKSVPLFDLAYRVYIMSIFVNDLFVTTVLIIEYSIL